MAWSAPARAGLLAAWAWLCAPGCDRDPRAGIADAASALARHRPAFVTIDGWVRRAMQGADLLGEDRALAEALFAKARAEPALRAAWVDQSGASRFALSWPRDVPAPVTTGARRVRDAQLGDLEVVVDAPCPVPASAVPSKAPKLPSRCTFVTRDAPGPRGSLRVAAAFENAGPATE